LWRNEQDLIGDPRPLQAVDGISSDIDGGHLGAPEAINRLRSAQITLRNSRRLQGCLAANRRLYCRGPAALHGGGSRVPPLSP